MGSRATSVPLTHGQERVVLHVGGDERETFLKTLRSCAFNRRRLSPLREVDRESRKVVYSINTTKTTPLSLGQARRRALSVPLTSDNGQRKHSRLANIQQFDASALDHPDTNPTGVHTSSNIGNLLNPSEPSAHFTQILQTRAVSSHHFMNDPFRGVLVREEQDGSAHPVHINFSARMRMLLVWSGTSTSTQTLALA
ncbi:hypothetical protein F4604DRAFT_1685917 [Suillus subluteus]|nr:hypothetical protein F4604DRAFT_1685917 [Suillus subluteus]